MNVGLHQFAQGGVDLSMACNQGLALKRFGDDVHGADDHVGDATDPPG